MYSMKKVVGALVVIGAVAGYSNSFADSSDKVDPGTISPCQYLPMVGNPTNPTTQKVCVDVPVNLTKARVVFNMDEASAMDGPTTPIGMKHMVQLAGALKSRIAQGLIEAEDVSIIGVFHGADASMLLNDAYWATQIDPSTGTNYVGNPYKAWLEQLLAIEKGGVHLQLEICGVTMSSKGWKNSDLYVSPDATNSKILVNQGAIGRLIALENAKFAYIQPGK